MEQRFSTLAQRLRDSDMTACDELFDALHEPLLCYARRLTKDEDAAFDVVQEAFIRMWRKREQLDPTKSLRGFMYRLVRNQAFDQMRMKTNEVAARARLHSQPTVVPSMEDEMAAKRLNGAIAAWVSELPERRQEAFRLSRYEGLSHQEISDVMGLTVRTVTNHIMLALQYLRERLAAYQASGY